MALFSARHPIFDKNKNVVAYELLYRRSDKDKEAYIIDGNQATARVLTQALMVADFDKLSDNKKIFINFTKDLILSEVASVFDSSKLVIEILEDIDGNDEIIEKIALLKKAGYTIALDDMAFNTNQDSLLPYVDIVKVDFLILDTEGRMQITRKLKKYPKLKLLAEKVETNADYEMAKSLGYSYFQGFFFAKPEIIEHNDTEVLKSTQIALLKELSSENIEVDKLVNITQSDVSLSLKLLKLISSAAYYTQKQITSIKEAIIRLGIGGFRKWIYLILLQDISSDKPSEVINVSMQRGQFLEKICVELEKNSKESSSYFLAGILSMLDVLTSKEKENALNEFKINNDLKMAILKYEGKVGKLLKLVECLEKDESEEVKKICNELNYNVDTVYDYYFESLDISKLIG